jgi:hypothetical protein
MIASFLSALTAVGRLLIAVGSCARGIGSLLRAIAFFKKPEKLDKSNTLHFEIG